MEKIELRVNNETHALDVNPEMPLIFVLRNYLGLLGAKLGCGLEQCGACAVLVNGKTQLTCVASARSFVGQEITTIEGLAAEGSLTNIQQAFVDAGAAQCGYCTPGMVIAVTGLLSENSNPSMAEINEALSPHLCRCGSHARVLSVFSSVSGQNVDNA